MTAGRKPSTKKERFITVTCDNCGVQYELSHEINLMDENEHLFYKTCIECTPTCSDCGQNLGYSKSTLISSDRCDVCEKESCRSCGINVKCDNCGTSACESCIDSGEENICECMVEILKVLREEYGLK